MYRVDDGMTSSATFQKATYYLCNIFKSNDADVGTFAKQFGYVNSSTLDNLQRMRGKPLKA